MKRISPTAELKQQGFKYPRKTLAILRQAGIKPRKSRSKTP